MCSCVASIGFLRVVRFVAGLRVVVFVSLGMWTPFSEWLTARISRRSPLLLRLVELREQRPQVERCVEHRDAVTVLGSRPFLLRAVAVQLDAVLVRVAEIDRFAHAVVG